uniref:Deuterosome assembly protein 1 n=1 Tax=Xenopus tropicalis TaxID=8364 RepID=DEUP1_XENTR|nr:RecName: Full=Deuterosome assembly protein 1; AltName: Full=Coiled-coil domain-containing protein 67 [Xenopus tropicalis]
MFTNIHSIARNSSCENELEELMHQIDIMVSHRKVEWEKHVKVLEQKLEAQDRELTEARNLVDEKNHEIGILCKKLEGVDTAQHEMAQNYERQLQALKFQLCKLKKSYEKLHFHQEKHQKNENAAQERSRCELQWLTQKIEEFKARSREWEKQRVFYQDQLKSLDEQRKTLAEKCQLFQKESLSYQEQLSSQKQLQSEAITNNQSEMRRLRCLLDTSQETIRSDGVIIENLKSTVKEITLSRDSLKDENQQLLQELRRCQKQSQNMEAQLYKAKLELQSCNDLLRVPALEERQAQKETANLANQKTAQGEEASFQVTDPRMNYMTSEPEHKSFNLSKSEKYQAENDLHGTEAKNSDLERLRKDIGDLTAKLNQKDVTIATVSRKVSRLERELELKGAQNRQTSMPLSQKDVIAELESEMPQIHAVNKAPQTDSGEVDPWISIKCGEHDKPQKHRSFHGENNSLKPTNYADTRNHSVGSEWESEKSLCPWNTPTLGSATDDDCDLVDNENEWLSLYNSTLYPGLDLPPISYACDQLKDSTNSSLAGSSLISAAEKFLLEETRRASDFEKILNSHIEEMKRNSESTVSRYQSHGQSRHI